MADPTTIPVCFSIDTEEDNWTPRRDGISVENIRALPKLQSFLAEFGARPTYFTAHAVVSGRWSADVIRGIHQTGRAEIAAHLHPWNTPPLSEPFIPRNTQMRNLDAETQHAKLVTLTEALTDAVGHRPTTFRAGRWGLGAETLPALIQLGYRVDSSVMPFMNWESMDDGANFVGAPSEVYRMGPDDFRVSRPNGPLIEVPVSSGYNRKDFGFWHGVHTTLHRTPLALLHLAGLASRAGLLRKIQLSPETDSARDMLVLARRLIEGGVGFLHMFWHSPSMSPGWSPYGQTQRDVDDLYRRIGDFVEGLGRLASIEFLTVGELGRRIAGNGEAPPGSRREPPAGQAGGDVRDAVGSSARSGPGSGDL